MGNLFVVSFGSNMNTYNCTASSTFGHHLDEFRLVGRSLVYRLTEHSSPTELEVKRLPKWMCVVVRARHLPVSFHLVSFLRTRSQFTWGTGTYQLATNKKHEGVLNKLGSAILRCLLRRDHYQVSPGLYFSPSLNPHFCRVVDGLLFVCRVG